ncbi:hypothetical protein GCM10029964_110050 [Kibdelosporangium lantanae]
MKSSQVAVFCEIFGFEHPGIALREVWGHIDAIVDQRNGIAHGRLAPEEVGRNYTYNDLTKLMDQWEHRWLAFLDAVESHCMRSAFYLIK